MEVANAELSLVKKKKKKKKKIHDKNVDGLHDRTGKQTKNNNNNTKIDMVTHWNFWFRCLKMSAHCPSV